jgi:hypothetical protein
MDEAGNTFWSYMAVDGETVEQFNATSDQSGTQLTMLFDTTDDGTSDKPRQMSFVKNTDGWRLAP